jgi:hypothetical protein
MVLIHNNFIYCNIQMVKTIVNVWISIAFIITILVIVTPLINMILNEEVIWTINTTLDNVEYFTGSKNLNIFLILLWTTLITIMLKFFFKFFKNWE